MINLILAIAWFLIGIARLVLGEHLIVDKVYLVFLIAVLSYRIYDLES